MADLNTRQRIHLVVDNESDPARNRLAMNSADVEYLWRTSDMFTQPLALFLDAWNLAIDDRIPPKGLKDD